MYRHSLCSAYVLTGSLPSSSLLYEAQEVTKLTLHVDSSSLKKAQQSVLCAEQRAHCGSIPCRSPGGGGNRVALYSVESPRRSLAPDPEPAGCERPPRILKHVHAYGHVCSLPCQSPRMPTHQLAATEPSMKCLGSDRMRQPVSLAFAAS